MLSGEAVCSAASELQQPPSSHHHNCCHGCCCFFHNSASPTVAGALVPPPKPPANVFSSYILLLFIFFSMKWQLLFLCVCMCVASLLLDSHAMTALLYLPLLWWFLSSPLQPSCSLTCSVTSLVAEAPLFIFTKCLLRPHSIVL